MQRPISWVRHLKIAGSLFVVATIGIVLWNWQTFSLMFANMGALSEGKEEAQRIQSPDDVIAYLLAYPGQGSIVAFDIGKEEEGIFWQAEEKRATAGLTKLQLLEAYAHQLQSGGIDPGESVAWERWEQFYLPGADQGHFKRQRGLWENQQITLDAVMSAALTGGDPISSDYMFQRLTRDAMIDSVFTHFEAGGRPLPNNGIFLSWENHTLEAPLAERMASYAMMPSVLYRSLAVDYLSEYVNNAAFRGLERELRTEGYAAIRLLDQRELALHTFPQATAQAYADYVLRVTDSTNVGNVREHWFHKASGEEGQALFEAWASLTGSFPGIFGFVGYAEREGQAPRVVVFLLEDMPLAVYYHLTQTSLDKGVPLMLLADDAFFERTRRLLYDASIHSGVSQ